MSILEGLKEGTTGTLLPIQVDEQGRLVLGNAGVVNQAIPDTEDAVALAAQWENFTGVDFANGDFVTSVPGLNGQAITVLSGSPLAPGESYVTNKNLAVYQPCSMEFAGSFVRTGISFATASLFANSASGPDPVPSAINITNISQSSAVLGATYNATAGTVVRIDLETALPSVGTNSAVYVGDWINITGVVDNRLNYPNACINYISPDRKVICVGFSDEAALPSLAIPNITPTLGTAKVNFYNNMSGARNGIGLRFTGTTSTSAAIVSIFGGDDNQVSGTLLGDHRVSISSSAVNYVLGASAAWGQYELRPSSRYLIDCYPHASVVLDKAEQTQTQWTPRDTPRTSVKPSTESALYPRFRLYKPVSMSRPVAKIVKAEKLTASTTATIYTDVPHGLTTGNYVTIKGVRDYATNFPMLSTPTAVTVVNDTTFTVSFGAAAIATSYGGSVIIANGGKDQPGIITQTIQSVQSRVAADTNWLDVVGSASWSGVNPGDYINLHGVRESVAGADVGVDGVWEVAHISTTTMVLKPVFDIANNRVSPALGTLGLTNCGGAVILRPTLRSHDLSVSSLTDNITGIRGQGTTRSDLAVPTYSAGGSVLAVQSTAASLSTTTGLGGWYVHPAITGIADIASAALTSTSTGTAISNNLGNGFQVTIPVTAVSGTTPTLDVRIEESFDGGTNWVTLYEFQRITATGSYNSPILRASGRHIRYIRTVAGTTPSFTHAVTRNILPFLPSEPQKRIVDRTVVPNTLNSVTPVLFQGAANNVQLVVNMGAITTTAPAFQVEGSEDAINWYAIGTPLTAVASSTVEATINKSATYVRARVSTAGSGATLGYVALKAWS